MCFLELLQLYLLNTESPGRPENLHGIAAAESGPLSCGVPARHTGRNGPGANIPVQTRPGAPISSASGHDLTPWRLHFSNRRRKAEAVGGGGRRWGAALGSSCRDRRPSQAAGPTTRSRSETAGSCPAPAQGLPRNPHLPGPMEEGITVSDWTRRGPAGPERGLVQRQGLSDSVHL